MTKDTTRPPDGAQDPPPANPDRVAARGAPQAGVRRRWWPGWIWAVPLAVLIVVGWLGIRALFSGGKEITISFDDAHGVQKNNTDVEFRGTKVGQVTGVTISEHGDASVVSASIDKSAAEFLTSGTRFWLQGANPSLSNLGSLRGVLSGPTIVMEPGPGKKQTHFAGSAEKPISPGANATRVLYEISLSKAESVKVGDPVTFHGKTVGEVTGVGFAYNPATGEVSIPATVALYAALFHLEGVADPNRTDTLRAAVDGLLDKGLSAQIEQDPPVVGSYRVSLILQATSGRTEPTGVNGLPQIPLAADSGAESIITRINRVPIERIGQNLLSITQHIDTLASSPKLKDSINQLSATLDNMHHITSTAGPEVTKLIASLRHTADNLDQAAQETRKVLGGTAVQSGLESTMQEITDTARSVRSLSDYLDRHPEALIHGREDEK